MKVRANNPAVDELVATVKAVTIKNRSRVFFTAIGKPTHPVLTEWGSWLSDAFFFTQRIFPK